MVLPLTTKLRYSTTCLYTHIQIPTRLLLLDICQQKVPRHQNGKFSSCDSPYLINFELENFVLLSFLRVCGFFHVHLNRYYSPQVDRKYIYLKLCWCLIMQKTLQFCERNNSFFPQNYIIAPLHVAAKYGNLNIVTLLVEKGSKVDIPNKVS